MVGNWPRSVIVVGAGIVGLSTAWFLQERGVQVDVVDRGGVAAGASWGNAGWIAPGLAIPLNEPSVLRYGLRSLLNPAAPLHVPASLDPGLWSFLARFAANSHWPSWTRAVRANLPLNDECVEAYEVLAANGVSAPVIAAPITAAFRTPVKPRVCCASCASWRRPGSGRARRAGRRPAAPSTSRSPARR